MMSGSSPIRKHMRLLSSASCASCAQPTIHNGWIFGWAQDAQEALDNSLMCFRIGEDPDIMLPQIVAMDGYFVTHINQEYEVPDQDLVDRFLPPFKPKFRLDVNNQVIMLSLIHISEPTRRTPISYAVFCLKK